MRQKVLSTIFTFLLSSQHSQALSLPEYLEQVKNNNLTYSYSNEQSEASQLLKKKADLVTAISLFGNYQNGFNQQNQGTPILKYTNLYSTNYQLGLSQTSDLGITTKLSYVMNRYTYKGLSTSSYSNPSLAASNYQTTPLLSVSIPLWQNRFGAATRASQDSVFYQNEVQKLNAQSVSLTSLITAEKYYWQLATARKIVEIQTATLKQAQLILQYVTRRYRMNLGDKADVLQAEALVEQKSLDLNQAKNDEKTAARNFNKQRYLDSEQAEETLESIDSKRLENTFVTKIRSDSRFDVKASEAQMKASIAAAKLEEENSKPSLNLTSYYALKGVEAGATSATKHGLDLNGREGAIGLNFSVPINFELTSDIRRGALKNASVAKITYRQKIFDQENDWNNLIQNLEYFKENLALAKKLESAQKSKLENERIRLKQGRTSTYQILTFEQDYSKSQLVSAQTAYQILGLIADKKLYDKQESQRQNESR